MLGAKITQNPVRRQASQEMAVAALNNEFDEFYQRNFKYARVVASRAGAEDPESLAQEAFIVALRHYSGFDPLAAKGGNPEHAWLSGIIRLLVKNEERRRRTRKRMARSLAANNGDVCRNFRRDEAASLVRSLLLQKIHNFLQQYDDDWQRDFLCAVLLDMSSRDIEREFGTNHNTVQARVRVMKKVFARRFKSRTERIEAIRVLDTDPKLRQETWGVLVGLPSFELASKKVSFGISKYVALAKTALAKTALAKLGAGLLVTSAFAGAYIAVDESTRAEGTHTSTIASQTPSKKATAKTLARERLVPEEPIVVQAKPGTSVEVPIQPPRAPSTVKTLPEQVPSAARALIARGRAAEALALLDSQAMPENPSNSRYWVAARVAALCQLNRLGDAKVAVEGWARNNPGVFTEDQLRTPCAD